jgi:pimeloyl-ACP methyl ester carboxylesterase
MTRQNITGHIERMAMPALVMGGHKDGVIPNHIQRTLASLLPHSETYFMKNGSHVPQADFPEMVNERINLFIQQNY